MILTGILSLALVLGLTPGTVAQTVDQAKKNVEQLQQKLETAVERYNFACSKLENTQAEMEQNKADLAQAEKKLEVDRGRLNERVKAMYMTRQNKFLDVVVNAGNLDEFLVGLDYTKKIGARDADLVREVKDAKAKLVAAKAALNERAAEQKAAKAEMASTKAAVESDLSGAKGKLAGIEQEIQQAMARRASEAATVTTSSSGRRSYPSYNPVTRPTRPPGAPHGGVVGVAYDQIGDSYVWGAAGPDAFDCSGLVAYCYSVGAGIEISHSSYAQASCGTPVSVSELQPGDIVGFRGWGHVGLYVGGGMFIEAPYTGAYVRCVPLSGHGSFCGAVRP